jgi:hypothetical protein
MAFFLARRAFFHRLSQRPALSSLHSALGNQHSTFSQTHSAFRGQHLALGDWHLVIGPEGSRVDGRGRPSVHPNLRYRADSQVV